MVTDNDNCDAMTNGQTLVEVFGHLSKYCPFVILNSVHTIIHTYIHTYIQSYIHTPYTHTHTHVHTYIHMYTYIDNYIT